MTESLARPRPNQTETRKRAPIFQATPTAASDLSNRKVDRDIELSLEYLQSLPNRKDSNKTLPEQLREKNVSPITYQIIVSILDELKKAPEDIQKAYPFMQKFSQPEKQSDNNSHRIPIKKDSKNLAALKQAANDEQLKLCLKKLTVADYLKDARRPKNDRVLVPLTEILNDVSDQTVLPRRMAQIAETLAAKGFSVLEFTFPSRRQSKNGTPYPPKVVRTVHIRDVGAVKAMLIEAYSKNSI